MCVYILIAILKKELGLEKSLYTILRVFSPTLFEKTPILRLFMEIDSRIEINDFGSSSIYFTYNRTVVLQLMS